MTQGQLPKSHRLARPSAKRKRSPFYWGDEEYPPGVRFRVLAVLNSVMMPNRPPRDQRVPAAGPGEAVTPRMMSRASEAMETVIELRPRTPSPDQNLWLILRSAVRTVKSRAFLCLLDPPGRWRRSLCRESAWIRSVSSRLSRLLLLSLGIFLVLASIFRYLVCSIRRWVVWLFCNR